MNLTGFAAETRDRARGGTLQRGVETAQSIISGDSILPIRMDAQDALVWGGLIGTAALTALGFIFGVPTPQVLARSISTEFALTGFNAVAGGAGFMGTFIASDRLASLEGGEVTIGAIMLPMLVTFAGNFFAGLLFPSG